MIAALAKAQKKVVQKPKFLEGGPLESILVQQNTITQKKNLNKKEKIDYAEPEDSDSEPEY